LLKEHNKLFLASQILCDSIVISIAWYITAKLSTEGMIPANPGGALEINTSPDSLLFGFNITKKSIDISLFSGAHLFTLIGLMLSYKGVGLYQSFRNSARFGDLKYIFSGFMYFIFPAWCVSTLNMDWNVSPWFVLTFMGVTLSFLIITRFIERLILKKMRSKGYNQRHLLVIGAGRLAQDLVNRIQRCRWMGFQVVGYLDDDKSLNGKSFFNASVLGVIDDLEDILKHKKIDQVYCTLPFDQMDKAMKVSKILEKTTADFRIVPDMVNLYTLNTSLFEIDGLPVLGVRESPLQGFNIIQKRLFDIVFSLLALTLLSPLFLILMILTKLTSKGSVFFAQQRMGLDNRPFKIYKFRSMRADAEEQTGPIWANRGDDRVTWLGAFMRKTSLDELPQFFNVLLGHMSVVGPRPERPEFISDFKDEIPRYMLRHKTKTGMTGWAQVNGWRGSTSLKKRIQYDLYYIENWSIWFDIRIVWDTVMKGFFHKNAY
jgi:Undecaprenyl-phosphate glucose phosphotransferase